MKDRAEHFGHWLRERIEQLGMQKQRAAEKIGVKAVTLRAWFNQIAPSMRPDNRINLSKLLGISDSELKTRLEAAEKVSLSRIEDAKQEMKDSLADFDNNVDRYTMEEVPEIPLFNVAVAAGGWVESLEIMEAKGGEIDHGRFRIRIAGDSMEPVYRDGDVVEFRRLRSDMDTLAVGKDYYVHRDDCCATFKRLEEVGDELVLRPLNKRKYRKPLTVARGAVVNMALAVAQVKFL